MSIPRASLIAGLTALLAFPAEPASQTSRAEPWRDWSHVSQLRSGQKIRIETVSPKRKIEGRFVSSDEAGITLEPDGGTPRTIAKTEVRRVVASRDTLKYGLLIGAAAGAIVFAVLAARTDDIVASGKAVAVGFGAGIGALGGWGIGALARHKLIYEAP